jgi:hypothetical protein
MSASLSLATVLRRGVPAGALACAGAADRLFLENVALLAQQVVPEVDLTRAQVDKSGEVYTLRLPWSASDVKITLAQMRDISNYSPFRIFEVCLCGGESASLVVQVATTDRPINFSEMDIVRVHCKRRCV